MRKKFGFVQHMFFIFRGLILRGRTDTDEVVEGVGSDKTL